MPRAGSRVHSPRSLRRHVRRPTALLSTVALAALGAGTSVAAQDIANAQRLAGLDRVQVRAEAQWDEAIVVEAGGGTADQFLQALEMTFEQTITSANAAPSVVTGSPTTVTCHVDTFYETGQIVYSLRTQVEEAGPDGQPVITWIKSWVGYFTVQQLHVMFTLGEQCANSFLDDWKSAN